MQEFINYGCRAAVLYEDLSHIHALDFCDIHGAKSCFGKTILTQCLSSSLVS